MRRFAAVLGCVLVALPPLTGCVPDERAEDGAALEAELRALPAVEAALVTNHVRHSTYRMLEVTVRVGDAVTAAELDAIQSVYGRRVAGRAGTGQSVAPLSVEFCAAESTSAGSTCGCPSGASSDPFGTPGDCSSLRSEAGVRVPNEEWLRLRRTAGIEHAHLAVAEDARTVDVAVTTGDPATTVRAVHTSFPDLGDAAWTFRSTLATIAGPDGIPDDAALAVWADLRSRSATSITLFRMRRTAAAADPDRVEADLHLPADERARDLADRQLTVLQRLSRPVTYRASLAGDAVLEVIVGGCSASAAPTAPPLQAELRTRFERC